MMNISRTAILLPVLLHGMSVQAESGERLEHYLSLSLEELMALEVSISTDTKQTRNKAPAVVSVITAEDIKATGATNLVEALEGVPGIHIRASHFGFRPLVHFRGANATQTLLMVNGASMKDLMWGFGIFWKGLPVSMIERVEIIRGPGSALFGADASAGVINVITKTASTIEQSEVGGRVGSFNTQTAWAQHGANWNGYDIGFTAEISDTDGHAPYIETDGQSAADQAQGTDVSYAPDEVRYGWRSEDVHLAIAKGNWRLQADYLRHSELEIGLTGAGVLDPVTRARDSRYNINLLYGNERFSEDWGLDAELRYMHLDYTSGDGFQERPPGYFDGSDSYPIGLINKMRSAERRWNVEASGLYRGFSGHLLRLGAGHTWQDLYRVEQVTNDPADPAQLIDISDTVSAFAPEKRREISHLFLQDIWTLSDDWELTAGARYDHYSDFGGTVNPRLALVWQSTERLTSKLLYGQAFRAPSYQELFAETSRTLPNDELDPERSETVELSFAYVASRKLHMSMNLYHFRQTDLIDSVAVAGLSKPQFQNSGDHTIRGVELEAQWQPVRDLRLSANYTVREQDDSDYRASYEPDKEAYLRADWRIDHDWNWNVQANWIGERERPEGDTRDPVDDYMITDTTLRYSGIGSLEFAASVRNLFDVDAREYTGAAIPDDLPLPERNYYAELRYQF